VDDPGGIASGAPLDGVSGVDQRGRCARCFDLDEDARPGLLSVGSGGEPKVELGVHAATTIRTCPGKVCRWVCAFHLPLGLGAVTLDREA